MPLTKLNFSGQPTLPSANMPTGSVLQVLHNESTSAPTFTGSSYTYSGFNQSITPSATSSKIFMIFDFTWYGVNHHAMHTRCFRNGRRTHTRYCCTSGWHGIGRALWLWP